MFGQEGCYMILLYEPTEQQPDRPFPSFLEPQNKGSAIFILYIFYICPATDCGAPKM